MTVAELITFLQSKPQNLDVAYRVYSEQCLMTEEDINIVEECEPRSDGWIQNCREDKPRHTYLMFPGN